MHALRGEGEGKGEAMGCACTELRITWSKLSTLCPFWERRTLSAPFLLTCALGEYGRGAHCAVSAAF